MDQKSNLFIECERLRAFLETNQLVQANGIVTRIENILNDIIAKESGADVEKHPLWNAFRASLRVKNKILSGQTREACTEMSSLREALS